MTLTCLLVTADQELKDAVHGPHVEDEPQLCDTHGDQAEQQDGAEHTVHERGGSCGKKARGSGQETWPIQHPYPGEGKKAPRADCVGGEGGKAHGEVHGVDAHQQIP